MQRVHITPEVTVDLALKTLIGRPVTIPHRGEQRMFVTIDSRALYLSPQEGVTLEAQLAELGVRAGQRILICKQKSYETGALVTKLKVWIAGAIPIGEQPDGSFVVPRGPGATTTTKRPSTPLAARLVAETALLVEAYAACIEDARRRGSQVKDEDIRALLSTAYLAIASKGVPYAA